MTTTFTSVLRQHTVEVGVIAERLAKLSAAIRVYRTAGRDEVADVLLEEFTGLLDDMSEEERTDLTLVLIARTAPPMALCGRCGHAHSPDAACPRWTCPTCLEPVPGLLTDCESPVCVALSIAAEAAWKRREDT
jgi:hypothetical protein